MFLTLSVFIILILFGIWITLAFHAWALMALINLIFVSIIVLRLIHDAKDKKKLALYFVGIALAFTLIVFQEAAGPSPVSRFLSSFMLLQAVQLALLVFLLAQLLIWARARCR
ncbi:hypothetical protein GF323_02535 [Candidatus Woesearchaeota archaeon]|nr:hypothetical protein [Candidatus Woesearchaeota archaeon]